jgi:NAD(P)-dependent dehydrogenase (short-subunit alcohol dehydrogenase family)
LLSGKDLSGKRVLVTGVSAGLGVETARALAAHGAQVVGAARDLAKAKRATAGVRAQAANGGGLQLVEREDWELGLGADQPASIAQSVSVVRFRTPASVLRTGKLRTVTSKA